MHGKTDQDKKEYVDDGRTIADMSGLERPGMFGHLPERMRRGSSGAGSERQQSRRYTEEDGIGEDDQRKQPPITRKERHMFTLAAVKAGLLIGLVYLVGCCAVIGLLYLVWVVL
ncbi:MAG: hypothetical protein LUI13_05125 [Lachnospiraceae bacterium]|nr:hypothetical protein [Lachnospiraceae bacterium]